MRSKGTRSFGSFFGDMETEGLLGSDGFWLRAR